jgi:heat shock protein HslJ
MVWGSRRIEPNCVTPQGFEEQGVPDAAKGDHIDGAAKDLREVVAKTHVGAEEVGRVVGEVDKHIDVAAAWVEVIARSRTHELEERHAAPRAGGSDAVEVVGDETDHTESLPCKSANRNGQSRDRRGEAADGRVANAASARADHGCGRAGEVRGFVGGTITSMTKIVPSLAAAAVIVVTLVSCASSPDPRPASPDSGTPILLPGIDRTEWICVELIGTDGKSIAVTDQPPSLFISAEGRASGFAGVNRYFAEATVGNAINYDNVPLRFGPVGATRMAGPPERMALEGAFTSMLGGVRSAAILSGPRGAVLTLRNERGECARFAPVRAP